MRTTLLLLGLACLLPARASAQCELQTLVGRRSQVKDFFGKSCSVDGDRLVVGAFAATSGRTGFAHVYELAGDAWVQVAKLRPSDGGGGDEFGNSVGISGDHLVVGSEYHDTAVGSNSGAAYLYERIAGAWTEVQKLEPRDAKRQLNFGESVAIEGDVAVIGCRFDSTLGNNSGAAYVFERVAGVWVETAKLLGSKGKRNDLSADSVAIGGGRILMGSYRSDASGGHSGSAYLFEKVGGKWTEVAHLVATDGAGELGRGLDIDGDRVVLGARLESTRGGAAGAGYVFEKRDGVWVQSAKLLPRTARELDWVGESVAVDGDRIVLSGHHHDLIGVDSGVATVFELQGGEWVETKTLQSSTASPYDEFSFALSMSGPTLLASAPFEGGNVGAAFVFTFEEQRCGCRGTSAGTYALFGQGLGGANVGLLDCESGPNPETTLVLRVAGIPAGTTGTLFLSRQRVQRAAFGGTLLVPTASAPIKLPFVQRGGIGLIAWDVPLALCGTTWYAQAMVNDPTQPLGRALTNGVELRIGD
jgi:hypothetical protein